MISREAWHKEADERRVRDLYERLMRGDRSVAQEFWLSLGRLGHWPDWVSDEVVHRIPGKVWDQSYAAKLYIEKVLPELLARLPKGFQGARHTEAFGERDLEALKERMIREKGTSHETVMRFYQALVRSGRSLDDKDYGPGAVLWAGPGRPAAESLWSQEALRTLEQALLAQVKQNPSDAEAVEHFWDFFDLKHNSRRYKGGWEEDLSNGGRLPDVPLQVALTKPGGIELADDIEIHAWRNTEDGDVEEETYYAPGTLEWLLRLVGEMNFDDVYGGSHGGLELVSSTGFFSEEDDAYWPNATATLYVGESDEEILTKWVKEYQRGQQG